MGGRGIIARRLGIAKGGQHTEIVDIKIEKRGEEWQK
jgi:hypothetical protein